MIDTFEAMLARGQDNALLRFSLGNAYLQAGQTATAVDHLREALRHDPDYSAAWKLLGKALQANGEDAAAASAFETGARPSRMTQSGRSSAAAARLRSRVS